MEQPKHDVNEDEATSPDAVGEADTTAAAAVGAIGTPTAAATAVVASTPSPAGGSPPLTSDLEAKKAQWLTLQLQLSARRISSDDLGSFSVVSHDSGTNGSASADFPGLRFVAGVDVSFFGNGSDEAIACISVLSFPDLQVVTELTDRIRLTEPYLPGFLAFRECPAVLALLARLRAECPATAFPQALLLDGNGTLHPHRFGLACHVGVLADLPTVGVAKNFLAVEEDGLRMDAVKTRARVELKKAGDWFPLVGAASGAVYGAAVRAVADAPNPIFVSPGHRFSLETAVRLAVAVSRFRVPEPTRLADLASRRVVAAALASMRG